MDTSRGDVKIWPTKVLWYTSPSAGPVHLTRKAFDLLLLLLETRPNAVTKDQIYARIWPDAFVTESSLHTLVREIRQALEHDSPVAWLTGESLRVALHAGRTSSVAGSTT